MPFRFRIQHSHPEGLHFPLSPCRLLRELKWFHGSPSPFLTCLPLWNDLFLFRPGSLNHSSYHGLVMRVSSQYNQYNAHGHPPVEEGRGQGACGVSYLRALGADAVSDPRSGFRKRLLS